MKEIVMKQFVRDSKNNPYGVVVALQYDPGTIRVGWSKTNVKAGDRYDKKIGFNIAKGRAEMGCKNKIPNDVQKVIDHVISQIEDNRTYYLRPQMEYVIVGYPSDVVFDEPYTVNVDTSKL